MAAREAGHTGPVTYVPEPYDPAASGRSAYLATENAPLTDGIIYPARSYRSAGWLAAIAVLGLIGYLGYHWVHSDSTSPAGSSADPTVAHASPPLSAAYVKRANAICVAADKRSGALGPFPGDPTKPTVPQLPAVVRYLTEAVDIVAAEVRQLRALPRPEPPNPWFDDGLRNIDKAIAAARLGADRARRGDLVGFKKAAVGVAEYTRLANTEFATAGLTVCAQD